MGYVRGESREQVYLLPEAIDDYVAAENPVRFHPQHPANVAYSPAGVRTLW